MTDDLFAKVDAWFSSHAVARPGNAPTLDADRLVGKGAAPEALLDAAVRAFEHAVERWGPRLPRVNLLLMIPLKATEEVAPSAPGWDEVISQLDRTPPSIYVIATEDMSRTFAAEKRTAAVEPPPGLSAERYRATYMCFQRDDDDPDDGWSRDIRVEVRG